MTSYLQEQLKSINDNKKELEEEFLKIQKKLELELEKNRILEMEGTIDKLKVQVNELSETIIGKIIPNNIKPIITTIETQVKKEDYEFHKLRREGKLSDSDLAAKRLILIEKKTNLHNIKQKYKIVNMGPGYLQLPEDKKFITLDKFKDNLSKVDNETQQNYLNSSEKHLVEIKPEIKIYDDILPIFRTMIGIIAKQQEEINLIKANNQDL